MPSRLGFVQRDTSASNDESKPKRRRGALAGVLLLLAGLLGTASPADAGGADTVNAARASAGLPALVESSALDAIAQQHSAAMAASNSLYHTSNLAGTLGPAAP